MKPGYNKADGHFRELRKNSKGVEQWFCIYCERWSGGMEWICHKNRTQVTKVVAEFVPLGERATK